MKLVLAVPVSHRGFVRAVQILFVVLVSLLVSYLVFGWFGTLVLAVELFVLGALLRKAARGE